ncbi:CBS domain-containing protein [Neoroseomonas alba]|nr:CBS domain-containing protein [Neoroseomonas alba]
MTEPTARDLMTRAVITIPPDMPVMGIVQLLAYRGISAVPVTRADGRLLGLVSLADLTARLSASAPEHRSWLRWLFTDPVRSADRYARIHGFVAEEVMATDIVTVPPDAPASEIAATLERKGLRRVLVTVGDRLQGVVTRSDLLPAVISRETEPADLPDTRIRSAILAAMRREDWADPFYTHVEVHDGIVEFFGFTPGPAVQRALRVLAEQVPGVKGIRDRTEIMLMSDQVRL